MPLKSLLIIGGPTASGKTAVCLEIAKIMPLELISFDSMQVYRGMPVLSQAPAPADKKALRAHLVGILEPSDTFDAARFRSEAERLITSIFSRGRTPLLSGGTGLYLRALLDGLFDSEDSPAQDERLRKRWLSEQKKFGGSRLHDQLKKVDPASAAKIHPNDLRRIVRALEVQALSGKPISERKTERRGIRVSFHCPIFFLDRDRADLYERVEQRVDTMLEQGLVKEVKRLRKKKKLSRTAAMALGIREMNAHLDGSPLEQAVQLLKQRTRNYAKRQLAWFRHEKGVVNVPVAPDEKPRETAQKILRQWEIS